MYKTFLKKFFLASAADEEMLMNDPRLKRTCYHGVYPYKIFPQKGLSEIAFAPVTVFYGGNGSGKTTLLNVIAEKLGLKRGSAFNGGAFFGDYVSKCKAEGSSIPEKSRILTSDDVFDYMLNVRYINDGVDFRREELFDDWYFKRIMPENRFTGMDNYDEWNI